MKQNIYFIKHNNLTYKRVVFDEVRILFHFNIILKHNGVSSTKKKNIASCLSRTLIHVVAQLLIRIRLEHTEAYPHTTTTTSSNSTSSNNNTTTTLTLSMVSWVQWRCALKLSPVNQPSSIPITDLPFTFYFTMPSSNNTAWLLNNEQERMWKDMVLPYLWYHSGNG